MPVKGQGLLFDTIRCKDNDEWLKTRRQGVGGSDIAALVGLSPWMSPSALYLDKTGNPLPDTLTGSGPVEFGNDFEQIVIQKFANAHPNMKVRRVNAILRSKTHPWRQASLDAEVLENGEWGIVEAKCPGSVAKWNDGIPAHYLAQGQYYMAISGRNFCWFAAFFRDTCEYKWVRIKADPDMQKELLSAADKFWTEHVMKKTPPTDTFGTPDEASALAHIHPKQNGKFLHAEDDLNLQEVVDKWEQAKADEKAASEEKTRLANYLMQLIGDNKGIVLDNARLTWRRGTSSSLNKTKLKVLYPNAIEECTETRPRNMGLFLKKTNS